MKVIIAVALFAFVAVQLCHAAPRPEDDKKEAAAPVGGAQAPTIVPVLAVGVSATEVKSESATSDAVAKDLTTVPVTPTEEKKE